MTPDFLFTQTDVADLARRLECPRFCEKIEESNPSNSSPYIIKLDHFREDAFFSDSFGLRDGLLSAIGVLFDNGYIVQYLMLGGSFSRTPDSARDLDCVVFYRGSREGDLRLEFPFGEFISWMHKMGIDSHLVPTDMDDLYTLKMAVYFSGIYGSSRASGKIDSLEKHRENGVILIDCR